MLARVGWVVVVASLVAASPASADTAPSMVTQPDTALVVASTDAASFTASATGSPVPTVQWQVAPGRDGPWTDIAGATSTTLTVTATEQSGQLGSLGNAYRAVFSSSAGRVVSRPAKLVWRTEWMRDLGTDISAVPLNELTLPGSHDMGTYGIINPLEQSVDGQAGLYCDIAPNACLRWSIAQDSVSLNIALDDTSWLFHRADATTELDDGIRYFDLRVCHDDSFFVTCHGLYGADLKEILDQTRDWVDAHPGELVFLDLNHHFGGSADAEAKLIEDKLGSRLIPPRYCTDGDPNTGTCANELTLAGALDQGSIIVNFENDLGTADNQENFGLDFYDSHPSFWGRTTSQPSSVTGTSGESCVDEASVESCFGNHWDTNVVLDRIKLALENPPTGYPTKQPFFLQFLQTTPPEDRAWFIEHVNDSLYDMALHSVGDLTASNYVIGPALFGCAEGISPANQNILDCFAQFRPENLNLLPINFYNHVDTGFDLVGEVIKFDEYARTPPVLLFDGALSPAATGWYNAAVLGGQGKKLAVIATVSDYRYPTGINNVWYQDNGGTQQTVTSGLSVSLATTEFDLGEGLHQITTTAEDGASRGTHGHGNTGAGPGSTPQPVAFKVDTVPPAITCDNPTFTLNQPAAAVGATVTDATSGPAAASLSQAVPTNAVGTYSVSFTAYDNAGNSTTGTCSYRVTYRIVYNYDTTRACASGSTIPVTVSLVDYFGTNVSSKNITLTATSVTNTSTLATFAAKSTGKVNANFTFITSPNGYLYALSTRSYASGAYTLDFTATRDPVTHHAPFVIR